MKFDSLLTSKRILKVIESYLVLSPFSEHGRICGVSNKLFEIRMDLTCKNVRLNILTDSRKQNRKNLGWNTTNEMEKFQSCVVFEVTKVFLRLAVYDRGRSNDLKVFHTYHYLRKRKPLSQNNHSRYPTWLKRKTRLDFLE